MARNSLSASGPSSLRKAGGISSGPGAPLQRILPIADLNSYMVNGGISGHLLSILSALSGCVVYLFLFSGEIKMADLSIMLHKDVGFLLCEYDIFAVY